MNNEKTILKDFAEGKIDTKTFWDLFNSNPKIAKTLSKDRTREFITYYSPEVIREHFDINNVFDRYGLFQEIKCYLLRNKIKCNCYSPDEEYISIIDRIQPRYVDIRQSEFWDEVLNGCPDFSTKKEKIAFLKEKTKKLFVFEKSAPKWIQPPEWSINNNRPLKLEKYNIKYIGFIVYSKNGI